MDRADTSLLPPPHARIGVGGVLLRGGKALVNRAVYRSVFTIPSGYVEAGETLEDGLIREFEEETGVVPRIGRLLLVRQKVVTPEESDVYFAFEVITSRGEPVARPPEIVEVREIPIADALQAPWISELSKIAISLGTRPGTGWGRSEWDGGASPGIATRLYSGQGPDATG